MGDTEDLSSLSKEELAEFQRVNSETIFSLEEEIKLLKTQIKQFGPDRLPSHPYQVVQRPNGGTNVADVQNMLEADIKKYSHRLAETARLTDITIEKVQREVLEMDEFRCKKRFSLELKVFDRTVHLVYDMQETLASSHTEHESHPAGCMITWFEVTFEQDINDAIGEMIAEAADEVAIHSVFSLLKTYLLWVKTRRQLVEHFSQMYPELVTVDIEENRVKLTISNPKPDHPKFILDWGRKTVNYWVEPDIRLSVEAPQALIAMDDKGILHEAPEMFSVMVKSHGLEKAITCLVKLVASTGPQGQTTDDMS
ncbi:uncharacterized protein LOC101850047 [Aplysia californica]|uniref:Uncharacterized protein LOC101850047 n=1 Tax=Aplysia californica TaxID=6500 RepID=A0ABM0JAM8_APLCA|nr:uncharacterized protein LOC101850047 [Aplysia californica]XP_005089289.1 uncharacterized protein LOC101850047 [Aplysia californica]